MADPWPLVRGNASTYYTSSVTAAKVPVSVGGIARAVGATLVTAVAGAADVTGLELRNGRCVDGDGSGQGAEDGGELHVEGLVVALDEWERCL
jgi:hypothetical protein